MNSRSRAIRLKAALSAVVILASTIAQPDASQARWYDTTTGLYHTNARYYHPRLGRFIQRDPNELALLYATAMAMNAQTHAVMADVTAAAQYGDGMHVYEFAGSNPTNGLDPTGLFSYAELLESQYLRDSIRYSTYGLGLAGLYGGLRGGYEAQLRGGTAKQIAISAVRGAGLTGYNAIAAVLVASALVATGPGGLALAGAIGVFESSDAYLESRERQEQAQSEAELSLATFDSVFATLGVGGSLYATGAGIRGAFIGGRKGPQRYVPRDLKEALAIEEIRTGPVEIIMNDMGDAPRLSALYGRGTWRKIQHVHRSSSGEKITVHAFRKMEDGLIVEPKVVHRSLGR